MKNNMQAMIASLLFGLLLIGCNRSDSAKHENQGSAFRRDPSTERRAAALAVGAKGG